MKTIFLPRWSIYVIAVFTIVVSSITQLLHSSDSASAITQSFTNSGSWTAPADVYFVTVEAWGGGGGGGANPATGTGGGGGGAYAASTIRVNPGNSYTISIGAGGGIGINGGNTTFNSNSVIAAGGTAGTPSVGGNGGTAAASTGTTKFSGGRGGDASGNGNGGGGGGGSATASVNGGDGTTANNGGIGGTGQGAGGAGGGSRTNGGNGIVPGGGAGGGGKNATSGSGASGQVTLTYTPSIVSVTVSDGTINYGVIAAGGQKSTIASSLNNTQVATNDGNLTENFNIRGSNTVDWTLAAASGSNIYVHEFCTAGSGSPDPCDSGGTWSKMTTAYQSLSTNVSASQSRRFDLRLTTPVSSTSSAQQSSVVTIQAVVP